MTFGVETAEQRELRAVVRAFFAETSPEREVRRLMATPTGFDPALWRRLAQEVGAVGVAIPAAYGGGGGTWAELGIVLEEAGRALFPGPLLSTAVLAATTLLEAGDEQAARRHLPGIAAGEAIATVCLPEAGGSWEPAETPLTAQRGEEGWMLRGEVDYVLDAAAADLLLVPARTTAGVSLFAVPGDGAGVVRTPMPTLDQTRRLATVRFDGAPAAALGEPGAGAGVLERVLDVAGVALALEQAGAARAALDASVAHLRSRVQFGQPIGAFQALKHMAADVLVEVESARSAAYYALDALESGSEEFALASSLAQAFCSEASVFAAHQNVQFHGGMGFTWEASPHLYYKRARSSEILFGDADLHRRRMAERLGI